MRVRLRVQGLYKSQTPTLIPSAEMEAELVRPCAALIPVLRRASLLLGTVFSLYPSLRVSFRILAKCLSIFRLVLLFGFPFILILRMRVSVRLAIGRAPGGQSGGARCIAIHRRARIRCAAAVPVMNAALTHALASRQCAGEERTDHRRLHRFRRLSAVRTLKHPVEYPLST